VSSLLTTSRDRVPEISSIALDFDRPRASVDQLADRQLVGHLWYGRIRLAAASGVARRQRFLPICVDQTETVRVGASACQSLPSELPGNGVPINLGPGAGYLE
jgi:hypothetical protein